jgi:ribonuclease P protein component
MLGSQIKSDSAKPQTFSKAERLSSKKLTDELFNKGSSFFLHPFRVYWMACEMTEPYQVLLTVSKKHFPLAVQRNRIKRLMREAFRKNKFVLIDAVVESKKKFVVAFLFTDKKLPVSLTPNPSPKERGTVAPKVSAKKIIPSYKLVEEKMIEALHQLSKNILK